MKKFLFSFLIVILFFSFVSADYSRNFSSVDLITREEWGADENWKYEKNSEYQKILKQQKKYKDYLKELKENNFSQYLNIKKKQYRESQRNSYLKKKFPQEFDINSSISKEGDQTLWWAKTYKTDKNKIILHHTDNNLKNFKNVSEVKSFLKNIYRNHSFSRGRGDIGYNFVIGPFGNIYEGRDGGPGVVGAHAKRNNTSSIGISLIGDFQYQKPTKQQLVSLIKLLIELSQKYNIDPSGKAFYHKKINEEPFIKNDTNYTIVGHRDAGYTSCPGNIFYSMLPKIRNIVKGRLSQKINLVSNNLGDTVSVTEEKKPYSNKKIKSNLRIWGKSYSLKPDFEIEGDIQKCYLEDKSISVSGCFYKNNSLKIDLSYEKPLASGEKTIKLETTKRIYNIKVNLFWWEDLDYFLTKKKEKYKDNNNFSKPNYLSEKVSSKLFLKDVKRYLNKKVKVLLYNLTQKYKKRDISCNQTCNLVIDGVGFNNINFFEVRNAGDQLLINIDGKRIEGNSLDIYNSGKVIFQNYDRKSYAGVPWNSFKGNIFIKKDRIDPLGEVEQKKYVIINQLNFDDYIKGIAEANDQIHIEKIKAMTLLIKNYVLFYLDKGNKHPSIPQKASYNAVDDARIFQKYVGAGFENTVNKWFDALEKTKNEIIVYKNYIPILPYFNCSAGFTWSAKEKFGWKDTPYLKSRLDFYECDNFKGHGVGLSGEGARVLAEHGMSYKTIIKYYYDGVFIKRIK